MKAPVLELRMQTAPVTRWTRKAGSTIQLLLSALALLAASQSCPASSEPALLRYKVVVEYPHDPESFTQGLEFSRHCEANGACNDVFWESTGLYGQSSVRQVDVVTGKVVRKVRLSAKWFGEGLARLGGRLYQLTWRQSKGFIYTMQPFRKVGSFLTPLQDGWGITSDGSSNSSGGSGGSSSPQLILSDGSSKLHWLDPTTFNITRSLEVRDGEQSIGWLNELEWVEGQIWANIWQTDCIAQIHPETGQVTGWLLMHGLGQELQQRNLPGSDRPMDVLNGIAYDPTAKRVFVTGKLWPRVFEISTLPASELAAEKEELQRLRRTCWVNRG